MILRILDYRFFFVSWIFFLGILSSYDFSYCLRHYQARALKFLDAYATPIEVDGKKYFIFYSKRPILHKDIVKSDPFIGLYLIKADMQTSAYKLKDVDDLAKKNPVALLDFDGFTITKILSDQTGFLDYAKLDSKMKPNEVVGNICYQIYGITTDNGFISKRYIERFLHQDSPYYGNIGVRIQKGTNLVDSIDPFFRENPFLPGDKILSINSKPITPENIEWEIASLPMDSNALIKISRNPNEDFASLGGDFEFTVKVDRSYGGLLLMDSFFESQGIKLDESLSIRRIGNPNILGLDKLRRGDRIVLVDGVDIFSLQGDLFSNLRKRLSDAYARNGYVEVLFSRNGFQFNVRIRPINTFIDERMSVKNKENPPSFEFRSYQ